MGGPGSGRRKGSKNKPPEYKSEYMNIMTKGTKFDPSKSAVREIKRAKREAKLFEDTPANRKKWKLANQKLAAKQKSLNKKK